MSDAITRYQLVTELTPVTQPAMADKSDYTDKKEDARRAALDRAHEIRKFEIDLYWKRATYFWILQAAVFTALGLTWKSGETGLPPLIPVALAALGSVAALAGWLSARGSKFWQENWEYHIDMLEDEFEGRLHKTAYVGYEGIAWSVSGVNDRLAVCFITFWVGILFSAAFNANPSWITALPTYFTSPAFQTALIFGAALAAAVVLYCRKTRFRGAKGISFQQQMPIEEGGQTIDPKKLPAVSNLTKHKKPFLIRREPKT